MAHRVLVVTVVHHPEDARIRQRQIAALLAAGWEVTYAAPWRGYGLPLPTGQAGLIPVDVRRAQGRRRWAAHRSARQTLRRLGSWHDLVLIHDPELVPATFGLRLPPVVWDVHEDTPATMLIRPWIPRAARWPLARLATLIEQWAERRFFLLLADHHYARRFRRSHPVVPNSTPVPETPAPAAVPDREGRFRVVYIGSLTPERGSRELIELGGRLRLEGGDRVRLQVVGPAHGSAAAELADADARGDLRWTGFLPSPRALELLDGALAGLSLLHDVANFRPSMPTKVVEYLAHGIPVITTPLPLAVDLVDRADAGAVVPFGDVDETFEHLVQWASDPAACRERGHRGHALVRDELDWERHGAEFVRALQTAILTAGARS